MIMNDDRQQFIRDHLSGLDTPALATKYGISQQAVAARLMWAKRHGEIESVSREMEGRAEATGIDGGAVEVRQRASDEKAAVVVEEPVAEDVEAHRPASAEPRSAAEIRQMFGTLQDRHNIARLRQSAQVKIIAYEKRIGRKDPGFRMAQELWVRQERCRLLGLTLNDLRRMRGIAV